MANKCLNTYIKGKMLTILKRDDIFFRTPKNSSSQPWYLEVYDETKSLFRFLREKKLHENITVALEVFDPKTKKYIRVAEITTAKYAGGVVPALDDILDVYKAMEARRSELQKAREKEEALQTARKNLTPDELFVLQILEASEHKQITI